MSKMNAATYHDLEGRFVDPVKEQALAEERMRYYAQHPERPRKKQPPANDRAQTKQR